MNRLSNFIIKNKMKIGVVLLSVITVLIFSMAYLNNRNEEIEPMTALAKAVQIKAHLEIAPEGYTEIRTPEDLEAISSNLSGNYILMQDIDMTDITHDVIGKTSSAAFTGIFDGNNYTISNLKVESNAQYVGMFGFIKNNATIKNILLDNVNITSTLTNGYGTGGLVGYNQGTITNAGVTGQVSGGRYTGGLVGYNQGTIEKAYSTAAVTGTQYVGGLVGYNGFGNDVSTIINAYSTGTVIGSSSYVGGLIGYNNNSGTITNSYAVGEVTSTVTQNVGGLIGYNNNGGTITNSYYAVDTTKQNISAGGEGKFFVSMLESASYENWDFDTVWEIKEGKLPHIKGLIEPEAIKKENYEYANVEGAGTEQSPYIIREAKQLKSVNLVLSAHYKLANDIDMSGITHEIIGQSRTAAFTGTFDGDGHKIINLTIESNQAVIGLFGYTNGATIKNTTLENINISGTNSKYSSDIGVGGLVGYVINGTITNVGVIGQVSGLYNTIGGLAGYNNGTITNSYSNVNIIAPVTGTGSSIGGLVGSNNGMITSSYTTGEVTGNSYVGGLVGNHLTAGTIENTFSTAKVIGNSYVGGLVGQNCNKITNSYAVGEVIGSSSSIGGLVGFYSGSTYDTIGSYYAVDTTTQNKENTKYSRRS